MPQALGLVSTPVGVAGTPAERKKMGVGVLLAGGRWGSCPTLLYGELRLCLALVQIKASYTFAPML
jgi:hypothetical protein